MVDHILFPKYEVLRISNTARPMESAAIESLWLMKYEVAEEIEKINLLLSTKKRPWYSQITISLKDRSRSWECISEEKSFNGLPKYYDFGIKGEIETILQSNMMRINNEVKKIVAHFSV